MKVKYLPNLMTSFRWVGRAIIAKPVPKYVLSLADHKYYSPSQEIVDKAFAILAVMKEDAGHTRESYRAESNDCDNRAIFDYNALLNEILPALCEGIPEAQGKGYDCGMYSFMRDAGKGRHRVAYVENDKGVRTYSDSYPINGTIKRKLSVFEQAAGFDIK